LLVATAGAAPLVVAAAETPKSGGTLTYVIPADAPPVEEIFAKYPITQA
jgi:hypothetical protein